MQKTAKDFKDKNNVDYVSKYHMKMINRRITGRITDHNIRNKNSNLKKG